MVAEPYQFKNKTWPGVFFEEHLLDQILLRMFSCYRTSIVNLVVLKIPVLERFPERVVDSVRENIQHQGYQGPTK